MTHLPVNTPRFVRVERNSATWTLVVRSLAHGLLDDRTAAL